MRPHGFAGVVGFSQQMSDYGEADAAREVPMTSCIIVSCMSTITPTCRKRRFQAVSNAKLSGQGARPPFAHDVVSELVAVPSGVAVLS